VGQMQLSLSQINGQLVALSGTTATIQTEIGTIKTGISNIEAKVTSIQGDIATISTTLGDLNGTITSIQEDIATIKTDIGEIKIALEPEEETGSATLWWILAAIIVIAGVTLGVFFLKIRKKKSA